MTERVTPPTKDEVFEKALLDACTQLMQVTVTGLKENLDRQNPIFKMAAIQIINELHNLIDQPICATSDPIWTLLDQLGLSLSFHDETVNIYCNNPVSFIFSGSLSNHTFFKTGEDIKTGTGEIVMSTARIDYIPEDMYNNE